jgi:hypothetical protein
MRCAQCGGVIRRDPVWSNGDPFCTLECAEESRLIGDDYDDDDAPVSEMHALFGADDDDF